MNQPTFTRPMVRLLLCCLLLNLVLFLTACGGGASAATMHLKKTEGTVGVADGEGNDIALTENLGLYSGYTVVTEAESYAWIDLDAVKLAKMDAESAVGIVKDGKNLTVNVQTGSLFFNVTEPLADDETMEIATSSMLVGIRGTCGWVTQNTAALLEGTVTVTAGGESITVTAGEMAVLTEDGALEVKPFSAVSVPAFVRTEVAEDDALTAQVLEAAGMDLSGPDPIALYARDFNHFFDEVLYTEFVDFAGDGDPELLVIGIVLQNSVGSDSSERNVYCYVYPDSSAENPYQQRHLAGNTPFIEDGKGGSYEKIWSLAEADGRLFLEFYETTSIPQPYHEDIKHVYWDFRGFNDAGIWSSEGVQYSNTHFGYYEDEYTFHSYTEGDSESINRDSDAAEFAAVQAKYTEVKRLVYSPDGKTVTVVAP